MAVCVRCAAELPPGARFCMECGSPVEPGRCSGCGEQLPAGARFCPSCGTPSGGAAPAAERVSEPVSERRVTSVLFADLVGFTPLSESRDPEDVRELLSRYFAQCRSVIGRYGGTVEKFIGDAVMAVWGVPVAHEDDAERAVRAGLELVEMVEAMGEEVHAPGLAMRVGVVTGEVAATLGAVGEGMVAGDAVNTASRVQSVASPGRVWTDETTRALTFAAIAYDDEGEHELKGKAGAIRLFSARAVVDAVGGGQRVDGLEAPLKGRDRELRLVKELFHGAEESRRPRLVVVDGEAGVGKSRLAWEFEKYVDGLSRLTMWHRGRCLSYGDGVAFRALAEAVRVRLGLNETDSGDIVSARLEESLTEHVADDGERDWIRPRLSVLVGSGTQPTFAREDLFAAWTMYLERVCGDETLVLVIDDAQYADDGLLDFVEHLLATARTPLFLLALARPELLTRRHDLGGRRTSVIRLDPLDDASMASLVDALVQGLPTATRDALVTRAEGVPLFAVETVRALIDRDAVIPQGGVYVPAPGAELDLDSIGAPASLQALVAARLDALSPEERRVVADASVLGVTFSREALAALAGPDIDLDVVVASLQRKEILTLQVDRFSSEQGQLRFMQGVVRQIAASTQSRRDRKRRHLAAADFLSSLSDGTDELAVVVAQHLVDALDASSPDDSDVDDISARAVALLARAGDRALELGAPGDASRMYTAAISRCSDAELTARLHLKASRAAYAAADYVQARDLGDRARELLDGLGLPVEAALAGYEAARSRSSTQDVEGARAMYLELLDGLQGVEGAEEPRMRIAGGLSVVNGLLGDWVSSGVHAQQALVIAEALDDREAIAVGISRYGTLLMSTGAPQAGAVLYEGLDLYAQENGLYRPRLTALMQLGVLLVNRDPEAAVEKDRVAVDLARRLGLVYDVAWSGFNFLLALWAVGRVEEAWQVRLETEELLREPAIALSVPAVDLWLAEATGRPAPEHDQPPESANLSDIAWIAAADISRCLARGDAAGVVVAAQHCIDSATRVSGLEDDFMHFWPAAVRAVVRVGDLAAAERLLAVVADAGPTTAVPPSVQAQLAQLQGQVGVLRGDDPVEVETLLRQGIRDLDAFGAAGHAARAREDLGLWLVSQQRSDEAAEPLAAARLTYAALGAHGWLAALDERVATASITG